MRYRFVMLAILMACSSHNSSTANSDGAGGGSGSGGSGAACTSDTMCAEPTPYCDTQIDQCVECLSDTNCGANRTCNTTTHACVQCGSDSQCGGQTPYCSPAGECVQCTADGNCGSDDVCNQTSFMCVPKCGSNADCKGVERGVCDTTDMECVQCLTGSDCMNALDKVCNAT